MPLHCPIFALGLFSCKTCAFQDAQGHDILPFTVGKDNDDDAPGPRLRNADSIPAPVSSPSIALKHAACNDNDDNDDDDNDGNNDDNDDANDNNDNDSGGGGPAAAAAAAGAVVDAGGSGKSGRQ
jgi:hypothetical protein